jgi:prepilin-type N-terminal cleavage/methylation domain-containing protein
MESLRRSRGFTVIELLVVIIMVCILALFVALAYSGVQAKNRNNERQSDIDLVQSQLEGYYAETNTYPTLANLSNATWRTQNLKHLSAGNIQDPHWSKIVSGCTADNQPVLAAAPTANCYSYQVTGSDGSMCDNTKVPCAHYTLTAILEGGGEKYVKSSLN